MKEKELYLEYMTKKKHQKKQKLEYVKFEKMQKFYVKWRKQNNGIQRIYRRSNGKIKNYLPDKYQDRTVFWKVNIKMG